MTTTQQRQAESMVERTIGLAEIAVRSIRACRAKGDKLGELAAAQDLHSYASFLRAEALEALNAQGVKP